MSISREWEILGIEPTDDPAQIREAYLTSLPKYHPEDDPVGFMKLRSAYEAALASAAKGGDASENEGDLAAITDENGRDGEGSGDSANHFWTKSIEDILSDFPRRMDGDGWKALIETASGYGFDIQEEFSDKLLTALMDGYYLPRRIWLMFDRAFSWAARADMLKEKFPHGYVEYVLNGMRYDRALRDEFFDYVKDKDEDFDAFIGKYHDLAEALRLDDIEKAADIVCQNNGSLFSHPDYRLLVARLNRMQDKQDMEREILTELDGNWPGDPFIRTAIGDMFLRQSIVLDDEDRTESSFASASSAIDIYLDVLKTYPEHYGAKLGIAHARLECGLYEEAKTDAYDLLMGDPYDGAARNVFGAANAKLLPALQEAFEQNPDDMEVRYKFARSLYNTGKYKESLDLIADIEPDEAHMAKHYDLYADLFVITNGDELNDEDKKILLEYVEAWEKAETDRLRLKFLPDKYRRLGMYDMALDKAEILLAEMPGEPEICWTKAQIFRDRGDERGAFASIAAGLEKNPGHAGLLATNALLNEDVGNLGAAVESANMSLDRFPFAVELWELLARIYDHASQYDDVLDTIRRASELGLENQALSLYKAIALFETEDADEEAQELFENALEVFPDKPVCLEKLGILYARAGKVEQASKLVGRLVELYESPYAYLLRGWIYANFPQASDTFAKARARADFRKAIEMDGHYAPAWFQLGLLAYNEGRMAEAAADFQLTLDIAPGFSDVHLYLSIAYDKTGDINGALRALDEGMAIYEDGDQTAYAQLYVRKADLFIKYRMFHDYAKLGEKPVELSGNPAAAAERRGDLANAYFEIGEDEKAEAMFQRALEEFETEASAMTEILGHPPYTAGVKAVYASYLKVAKKDFKAALDYLKQAYAEDSSFNRLTCLAEAYRNAGDERNARVLFKKALSLRPRRQNCDACDEYNTAKCYFGLGNYKKAKEYLGKAIAVAPNYADCPHRGCYDAMFLSALIALAEDDREAARAYYKEAVELAWDRAYREAAALFE